MYAAIAKNGESINGIKAGSPASLSLSFSLDIATRSADFTTALRAFAISRSDALPLPNRARASEQASHE